MTRRSRADMIEETRNKLLTAARQAFASQGYANTSMDDFTAAAGLTRGALYHHFGGKEGLLAAVVEQIDMEIDQRLQAISASAPSAWEGFRQRCRTYLELALEPEIRRIVLQDARAILGDISPTAQRYCIASMQALLQQLIDEGTVAPADAQALAQMLYGVVTEGSFWIAENEALHATRLQQALHGLDLLLRGLLAQPLATA